MTKKGVRPKKHLGQHFLKDENIAGKIVDSLLMHGGYQKVLEIGPGMGVLTKYLEKRAGVDLKLMEIDEESILYLRETFPQLREDILAGDFLRMDFSRYFKVPMGLIGNFPYNISSQIFFKVLEHKTIVQEVVCMIQKEVADRIVSPPGNKVYGILSVLLQAFYDIEYLFTVPPSVFNPPPKVNSAVIRLRRNKKETLECSEKLFFRLVKQGFQNRRKTLRNALKPLNLPVEIRSLEILDKRAEQLSVDDFIALTCKIDTSDGTTDPV